MRHFLVVGLVVSSLSFAVPRDGGWLEHIKIFIHRAVHHIVSTGDDITPPKP